MKREKQNITENKINPTNTFVGVDALVIQPTPFYIEEGIELYRGKCEEVLPSLQDESVNLIVTSPPYNLGEVKKGGYYGGKGKGLDISYDKHIDKMVSNEYRDWQHQILNECWRILKPNGAIFYNHKPRIIDGIFDDRRDLIPLPIRQEIIWDRCGMINFCGSFFAPNTERVFIIAKPDWKPNKETLGWGEVWKIPPEINTEHPAPFPLELAKRCIISGSKEGDVVLDPFSGSGTTLRGAKLLGRKGIGIELSENYCELTKQLLNPKMPLFEAV